MIRNFLMCRHNLILNIPFCVLRQHVLYQQTSKKTQANWVISMMSILSDTHLTALITFVALEVCILKDKGVDKKKWHDENTK